MNITYITKYPTLDIKNWSGTEYFIAKALENQGFHLDYITGLEDKINLSVRIKSKIFGRDKKYLIKRSPEVGKGYAKQILKRLNPDTDLIFSPATEPIAYLNVNKPIVFYTDATFPAMLGYNPWFDNLSDKTIKESLQAEQKALDRSSFAFYSSDWAARSAINNFEVNPNKVKVIPFGGNISARMNYEQVKGIINNRKKLICKILFLAVDWNLKRGDIVLNAVKYLNEEMKMPAELDIVGIDNFTVENLPSYVKNHGRISKATPEGIKKIENFIAQSHFLFVPSSTEAFGLVFCEAMAFGVPCISTNTGGIPTIVKNNESGILLDMQAGYKEYAEQIYNIYTKPDLYDKLAKEAFHNFESRLNWDVAGKTVAKYLKEL